MNIPELKKHAVQLRIDTLNAIYKAKSGHPGGSLSVMDILVTLYYGKINGTNLMKYDPNVPGSEEQDYFVLSKGYAAPALYTILADKGFFDKSELDHLRQPNSLLQGYPSVKIPGIAASTGSPGLGLSQAVGMAIALKKDRKSNRIFCVIGETELQEGISWEAIMAAAHYKCDNLILMIDNNQVTIDGHTRSVMNVDPITEKFDGFGWRVIRVTDGHNFEDLLISVDKAFDTSRKPVCIICNTVKGKGVPFAERKPSYHSVPFSDAEINEAIPLLEKQLNELKNETA